MRSSQQRGTLTWVPVVTVTVVAAAAMIVLMARKRRRLLQDAHGRMSCFRNDKENDRVLDRLRRSDPTLKNLCIFFFDAMAEGSDERDRFLRQYIIPAIDTIADCRLYYELMDRSAEMEDCMILSGLHPRPHHSEVKVTIFPEVKRLIDLHRNIRNNNNNHTDVVVKLNPNLETLEAFGLTCAEGHYIRMRLEATMVMSSCTVCERQFGTSVDPLFKYTFQRKEQATTVTTTYSITFGFKISCQEAVTLIASLALDRPGQVFIFHGRYLRGRHHSTNNTTLSLRMMNDDSAVRIVRALCQLQCAKVVTFKGENRITASGGASIIKILKETDHTLTKLELFDDDQVSAWQIAIRIGIDQQTWAKHFLGLDAGTQERLFLLALKRSEAADIGRGSLQRSLDLPARSPAGPDMLFYLVKKKADLIQHATRF